MIHSTTHHLRLPIYGQANQPQVAPQQGCPYCSDPVLEARKGRLYLLATPDTERDLLKRFALRYYGHPSYDIMPTLHEAMAFAHSDHGLQGAIHVAVIVHDLSVYAVATDEGDVHQVRSGAVSRPLDEHSFTTRLPVDRPCEPDEEEATVTVRSIKARLTMGDSLVLALRQMPPAIGKAIPKVLRQAQDPTAVAGRLSRLALRKTKAEAPFAVIMMPGLSPFSGIGLTASRPEAPQPAIPQPAAAPRERGERSPIWVALAFATVAIAFSVWMTKPTIDTDAISEMFTQMLTAVPTETVTPEPEGE